MCCAIIQYTRIRVCVSVSGEFSRSGVATRVAPVRPLDIYRVRRCARVARLCINSRWRNAATGICIICRRCVLLGWVEKVF